MESSLRDQGKAELVGPLIGGNGVDLAFSSDLPVFAILSWMNCYAMSITLNFGESTLHFGAENTLLVDFLHRRSDAQEDNLSLYLPLVLCGPNGCGKSSLALKIADECKTENDQSVVTTTSPDLARLLAVATKTDDVGRLSSVYKSADMLVIDDIHLLRNRDLAQQWLSQVLDFRDQRRRPTVVTCDGTVGGQSLLSDRLRSRLSAGLCISIELPHAATRKNIIQDSANSLGLELGSTDIEQLVSITSGKPARAIHALLANSAATRGEIISVDPIAELNETDLIRQILRNTARKFGVRVNDLKGPSRRKNTAMARAVAMFLIRQLTPLSLCEIGSHFRNRDHTTVRHACQKVATRLPEPDVQERIQSICDAIGVRTRTSWFNGNTKCA